MTSFHNEMCFRINRAQAANILTVDYRFSKYRSFRVCTVAWTTTFTSAQLIIIVKGTTIA